MMERQAVGHWGRGGWSLVPDVLKCGLILQVMGHHAVLLLWRRVRIALRGSHCVLVVLVVIHILFAHEVFGAFVLMSAAIILVSANGLVDITRGKFIELLVVTEDDDCDVDGAQHRELMGFFE
jgi:hypothetical protein